MVQNLCRKVNPPNKTNNFKEKKDKNKQFWNWYPSGYCWSHGFKFTVNHFGMKLTNHKEGHKDNETRANTMDGVHNNEGWVPTQ